jgi:hypothetical protein
MAALVCTVGVTDRSAWTLRASIRIVDNYNAPSVLSLTFKDSDALGGFRPALDDPITIIEGAVTRFGGLIITPEEEGPTSRLEVSIDAIGYLDTANYCYVTRSWAAGTMMGAVLAGIITDYLGRYGITLAPSITIGYGPSMPALDFTNVRCLDVLTQLAAIAGGVSDTGPWAVSVSPTKVLSITAPGATDAPVAIRDGDGVIRGEPRYRKTRENYADRVLLICGNAALQPRTELTFIANGTASSWYTDYPDSRAFMLAWVTLPGGAETPWGVGLDEVDQPLNVQRGDPLGNVWTPVTAGASHNCARLYTNPGPLFSTIGASLMPNSTVIRISHEPQFPFTCIDDAVSATPHDIVLSAPSIMNLAAGQASARGERLRRSIVKKELQFLTKQTEFLPNQVLDTQVSRRGINSPTDFLITQVERSQVGQLLPRCRVTTVEGSYYLVTSTDYWKPLGSASSSGAVVVSGGGGGGGGGSSIISFGGSSVEEWPAPAASAYRAANSIQVTINTAVWGGSTGTLYVRLRAASGSVTARLRDLTTGATAGTSAAVTNTDWQTVSFPVSLTPGLNLYEVQLCGSVEGAGLGLGSAYLG